MVAGIGHLVTGHRVVHAFVRGAEARTDLVDAGATRVAASASDSPPGAWCVVGERRQAASSVAHLVLTTLCGSPSQSPWAISVRPSEPCSGAAVGWASAIAFAVAAARDSGECHIPTGGPGGIGSGVCSPRCGEATGDERGLALAELGERRILAALEATLGDPGRLAVSHQDQRAGDAGQSVRS